MITHQVVDELSYSPISAGWHEHLQKQIGWRRLCLECWSNNESAPTTSTMRWSALNQMYLRITSRALCTHMVWYVCWARWLPSPYLSCPISAMYWVIDTCSYVTYSCAFHWKYILRLIDANIYSPEKNNSSDRILPYFIPDQYQINSLSWIDLN